MKSRACTITLNTARCWIYSRALRIEFCVAWGPFLSLAKQYRPVPDIRLVLVEIHWDVPISVLPKDPSKYVVVRSTPGFPWPDSRFSLFVDHGPPWRSSISDHKREPPGSYCVKMRQRSTLGMVKNLSFGASRLLGKFNRPSRLWIVPPCPKGVPAL
jgi:hypothetical protein